MSINVDCTACSDLQENSPSVIVHGIGTTECNNLKNNEGLSGSSNDCNDLNDLNDCLVGNMDAELEAYDICDWKDFMHNFIPNVYTVLKGIICAICGIWTNINKLWCYVEALFGGIEVEFDEDDFDFGTGVTGRSGAAAGIDLSCHIKGSLARFHGSVYIDLSNSHWGSLGLKNNGTAVSGHVINTTDENWTIAILKIKKSKYPMIKKIYSDAGSLVNAGCGHVRVRGHDEGTTYPGQWGTDSAEKTVPNGWYYVRVDLSSLVTWGTVQNLDKARVTFDCLNMAEIEPGEIDCE